jgi:hypothetical protein
MSDFAIKANDTLPVIDAVLGYSGLRAVPDLTGSVRVEFIMRAVGSDGSPVAGVLPKVKAPASVVDVASGRVRYSWKRADTDTPGSYLAEWEVTFPDLTVQTFPLRSYHTIDVLADLDNESGAVA